MNTLWNSAAYQQDLGTTASNIVHLERLKDTSILITGASRSEEHTTELHSPLIISYDDF